jgi:ribonuclease VapC
VTPNRRVVFDASAVLAWVLCERGYEIVDKLMPFSVVPACALSESLYRASERGHALAPDQLRADLLGMGIWVEAVTDADTVRAAQLIIGSRSRQTSPRSSSLSLGDGLCLAVAERLARVRRGSAL